MQLSEAYSTPRRVIFTAGTSHYKNYADANLPSVVDELGFISKLFHGLGYPTNASTLNPTRNQLYQLLTEFRSASNDGDIAVVYYTGHGHRDTERFYILATDTDHDLDLTGLAAEDIARALTKGSKAAQILMIFDTCYGGSAVVDFSAIVGRLAAAIGSGPGIFILAAARSKQEASEGALSAALCVALQNADSRLGGITQPFLAIDEVMGVVDDYLQDNFPAQTATWASVNVRGRCQLFPNPRYRQEAPSGIDLESHRDFEEHWLPKSRGAELASGGWYFTGREKAIGTLTAWLAAENPDMRPRVVTGGPGSGKSALIGRIVALSDSVYRKAALSPRELVDGGHLDLPPIGVIDVAIHARHKLLVQVIRQMSIDLALPAANAEELVSAIGARGERTVVVLDALDEADDPEGILTKLLFPLARLGCVRLIVGTRPNSTQVSQRFCGLGENVVEIDLDSEVYSKEDDVAVYVERRLLTSEKPTPYRAHPEIARQVALAVAIKARNVFLIARTAAQSLLISERMIDVTQPNWVDQLPTGIEGAIEQFLGDDAHGRTESPTRYPMRAVLTALAFSEGEGLPWGNLWAKLACAISEFDITDNDIRLTRADAAAFVVESTENGRSVYRLYHESIAEYLRSKLSNPEEIQRRIFEALLPAATADDQHWSRVHPYVLTYIALHAEKGGVLDELLTDDSFLVHADAIRLMDILPTSKAHLADPVFASYSSALHNMSDQPLDIRHAYLRLAAVKLGNKRLCEAWSRSTSNKTWSPKWARWTALSPHRAVYLGEAVRAVVSANFNGLAVFLSGGNDGVVRMWDLITGKPIGSPMRGPAYAIRCLAVGELNGRSIVVGGGNDDHLWVWDLETAAAIHPPLRGHTSWINSVALHGEDGGGLIAVTAGNDRTIRKWNLASGLQIGEPLRGHEKPVTAAAVAVLNQRKVIVSISVDKSLRFWNLTSGSLIAGPVAVASEGPLAITVRGDRALVIVPLTSDTAPMIVGSPIDVIHLRVGDLSIVDAISTGELDGRQVVLTGSRDHIVRIWDVTSEPRCLHSLSGHENWSNSVALGALHGRTAVVSAGNDGTLRIWDQLTTEDSTPTAGIDSLTAITSGKIVETEIVVCADHNQQVHVLDAETGLTIRSIRHRGVNVKIDALGFLQHEYGILLAMEVRWRPDGGGQAQTRLEVWDLHYHDKSDLRYKTQIDFAAGKLLGTFRGQLATFSAKQDRIVIRTFDAENLVGAPAIHSLRARLFRSIKWIRDEVFRQVFVCLPKPNIEIFFENFLLRSVRKNVSLSCVTLGTVDDKIAAALGSSDGTIYLRLKHRASPLIAPLMGHKGAISALAIGTLANRPVIVSGGEDGTVRVWLINSKNCESQIVGMHNSRVHVVAIFDMGDQGRIVSGGRDRVIKITSERGEVLHEIQVDSEIRFVEFSKLNLLIVGTAQGVVAFNIPRTCTAVGHGYEDSIMHRTYKNNEFRATNPL